MTLTRRTRDALGLTQAELAAMLGVHPQTVSKRERKIFAEPPEAERLMALMTGRMGERVRQELRSLDIPPR